MEGVIAAAPVDAVSAYAPTGVVPGIFYSPLRFMVTVPPTLDPV